MGLRQALCQSRTLQEKFVSQHLPVLYRDSHGAVTYSLPISYTPRKVLGTAKWLQRTLWQSRTCQVCFTGVAHVVSVPHTLSCQVIGVPEAGLDWTIRRCLKSSSCSVCFQWVCVCVRVCVFQKKCVFSDRDFLLDYTVRFLLGVEGDHLLCMANCDWQMWRTVLEVTWYSTEVFPIGRFRQGC